MKDKISINITTYNRSHLLSRCLDSVLNQSYINTEVIVIDDCSEDNTENVVNRYLEKYPEKIKYIRHSKNLGLARARNTGVQNSKGKYIAFMDDDDEWIDRDKLKKQIKIFEDDESNKIGIVCSSVRLYSNKNKFKDKIIKSPENFKKWILKRNGIIYTPTVLTKKEILNEVGGFDSNFKRGIDTDFYRNSALNFGYSVYFLEDITTAVHEYGDDRITPQESKEAIKKSLNEHFYIIKKYFKWFLIYPTSLLYRIKAVIILCINYFLKK
jgi:glycosyltransferase involved in cell wall biosynthesis